MKYLMVLILAFFQDCGYDRPVDELDTADLATELKDARDERDTARKWRREAEESRDAMLFVYRAMHQRNRELMRNLDRATRNHALVSLERILLERYADPFDRWFENPALAREPIQRIGERWYVLVVEPVDKVKGTPIWVKFCVNPQESGGMTMEQYTAMKRRGILDNLERAMVLGLEDPEIAETIREGTAHIYRLPTKDSPVEKVKPEDRIY